MAEKHENIKRQVQIDWSKSGRGRLYPNNTGSAFRYKKLIKYGLEKGSSDLIGYEWIDNIAVFASVEIKTKKDTVKPEQKNWLNRVTQHGGRAYIIRETKDGYKEKLWNLENIKKN
jgi:hypothetical protein